MFSLAHDRVILQKYMEHLFQMSESVVVGSTENKYLKHMPYAHTQPIDLVKI